MVATIAVPDSYESGIWRQKEVMTLHRMKRFEFDRDTFYRNILKYTEEMKMSIVEFASICDVAPTTIYRLKWVQFAPSMDSFLKICEVLQKEPKEYFL